MYDSILKLDGYVPEPYNVKPRDPTEALVQIERVLSKCSGAELGIIAQVLTALKSSLDDVLR